MNNKKGFIIIFLMLLGILLGFISSIINDYIWYIIIFSLILGIIGGFFYNYVLKNFNINSKSKKFIYLGIGIFVITVFFSINAFDYNQAKKIYNAEIAINIDNIINKYIQSKDSNQKLLDESEKMLLDNNNDLITAKNVTNNMYGSLYKLYSEAKLDTYTDDEIKLFNKQKIILIEAKKYKNNGDYEKMIESLISLYNTYSNQITKNKLNEIISILETLKEQIKTLKSNNNIIIETNANIKNTIKENEKIYDENIQFKKSGNYFQNALIKETGFGGYLGFQILSIKNGGGITTNGNSIDTGFIGEIILIILDIIALAYGMLISLKILNTKVCDIHNKLFQNFGKKYLFPTIAKGFNSSDIETIMSLINTKHEKTGLFSKSSTYYTSIEFHKCPMCEFESNNTIIEIQFSHYGESNKKPINGTNVTSFTLNNEEYKNIKDKLDKLSHENPIIK